jgi:two-component system response regulator RpfG
MSVTTCPKFTELDPEIIQDFSECLQENVEQIEACISLLDSAFEPNLVHRLFRDVHSLKGN